MQENFTRNKRLSSKSSQEFEDIEIQDNHSIQIAISEVFKSINQVYSNSKNAIVEIATNVAYNVKHSSCPFVNRKEIILQKGCEPACLLGKKYSYEQREQFYNDFHSIIWICYRSKLEDKFGDAGWGCMIRVCQMVMAQTLKRGNPNMHNSEIIKEFSTSNSALFSFDKICMEGKIMKRWTSSAEIMIAFQDLLKDQDRFKLKVEMYNAEVSIQDIEKQQNYPLLMIVNNRVSTSTIEQKMRDHLYQLLGHKNSIGMISGIGGEAIYIAGYYEQQLITLDPHFVQSETEGQKIYFNQVPRGVPLQKLVPAAGFCFYFKTQKEHVEWVEDMAQSWYFHNPNVVIECQQKYSKVIYDKRHPKPSQGSDDDDYFEILE